MAEFIAVLGGPVGAVIAATSAAVAAMAMNFKSAASETEHHGDVALSTGEAVDQLNNILKQDPSEAVAGNAEKLAQARLDQANATYKAAAAEIELRKSEAQKTLGELNTTHKEKTGDSRAGATYTTYSDYTTRAGSELSRRVAEVKQTLDQANKDQASLDAALQNAKSQVANAAKDSGGMGSIDLTPDKKEKKGKDDLVQRLDEELTQRKAAWDIGQAEQDQHQQYSLASEVAFWGDALKATDLSAKDRSAIMAKQAAAELQINDQTEHKKLDAMAGEMAQAGKNADARAAIAKREADEIGRYYGLQSTQYADAVKRREASDEAASQMHRAINTEIAESDEKLTLAQIAQAGEMAKWRASMGLITKTQLIAIEQDLENQRWSIEQAGDAKRLELLKGEPLEYQKMLDQMAQAKRAHENKITQLEQQGISARKQLELQAAGGLSQSWGQALGKMATLQATFADTIKALWQGLQQAIGNAIGTILQNWLTQQLSTLILGGVAKKAAGLAEISANAGIAGSAAWASTAAIPIVGPELAPAAAAAAAAGAMSFTSFLSMPGYDVGAWNISKDHVAMVHGGEMILPPDTAGTMRSMIGMFSGLGNWRLPDNVARPFNTQSGNGSPSNFSAPGASTGPATHVTVPITIQAWDGHDVHRTLTKHSGAVFKAVEHAVRHGSKAKGLNL